MNMQKPATKGTEAFDFWETHYVYVRVFIYRVVQNDCRRFNNLSYTIPL